MASFGLELEDFDLYINANVLVLADGNILLSREHISYYSDTQQIYHPVIQGDTMSAIAHKYYQKYDPINASKYYKYIADVNNVLFPLDISEYIGTLFLIPDFHSAKLSE